MSERAAGRGRRPGPRGAGRGAPRRRPQDQQRRTPVDVARRTALSVLRQVTGDDAYANLALAEAIRAHGLSGQDAALCTELVSGTCRGMGTYDAIIEAASGRRLTTLQPAVVDVLRLAAHQVLGMRTPPHAAVSSSVELARVAIGERVTGVVNAIVRRIGAHDLDGWVDQLGATMDERDRLALATLHPRWIVDAWADVLPDDELRAALDADNVAPAPTLVVRPGLSTRDELLDAGGEPTAFSPFGVRRVGNPSDVGAVRAARAGVQDEGSQLVAWALSQVDAPSGPWLDTCAGPGGKSALLAGLAGEQDCWLLAGELQPHRATLVARSLSAYPAPRVQVVVADAIGPAWSASSFARVMADVPCSGLGALRRRPDARWRKLGDDIEGLHLLQRDLLARALDAATPGGVVAYVTCSPHRHETVDVLHAVLGERDDVEVLDAPVALTGLAPDLPDCAASLDARCVQLWPHRHGTDAMFLALLRRR